MRLELFCRELIRLKGIEPDTELSLNRLIHQLKQIMPEFGNAIAQYKLVVETRSMLISDFETRHKIPDMWKMQLSRLNVEMEQSLTELIELCKKHGYLTVLACYLTDDEQKNA